MKTLDLRKQYKELYTPPSKQVVMVDVPKFQFLMMDGKGDPNTAQAYQDAIAALYGIAYTLKFTIKKEQAIDYPVMALEGLWWVPGVEEFSLAQLMQHRDEWEWTMMIMQPDFITRALVKQAMADLKKKRGDLPALDQIRLASLSEGKCAQVMHLGPYSAEAPNIERLHAFILDGGHKLRGKHHEIYLGDPRRTQPEKLKTVLRQPYK